MGESSVMVAGGDVKYFELSPWKRGAGGRKGNRDSNGRMTP